MKKKLNWTSYSNQERTSAIEEIKERISSNGGFILYSNFFSNISINFTVVIEEKNVENFHYGKYHLTLESVGHSMPVLGTPEQ